MSSSKLLLVVLSLMLSGSTWSQSSQSKESPSLIVDVGRSVQLPRVPNAQSFQINSTIMKERRRVLVVLPASYDKSASNRRYPVMVVTDGDFLTPVVAAVSDELSRNGQIPESMIVGVENVGGMDSAASDNKRVYDLTPPGMSVSGSNLNQGGDLFLDFIEKELLPAVDRQFRTAAPRFFVGHSSGGVLATYAAATRPTYSAVVSLDAPIHLSDNWLAKKLTARAAIASPLRYASLEAKFGWPEPEWKALMAKAPTTWKLHREKFQLEGHETVQMIGTYVGLRQVFSDYSRFSSPEAPTTAILPYYEKVGVSFGSPIVPPKKILQDVVDSLLGQGLGTEARQAFGILVTGYGAPPNGAKIAERIATAERQPPPSETIDGLLATAFPSPSEASVYIGEWTGDILMKPDQPKTGRITLRIRVVDGRVIGETVRPDAPPERRVQRWEYFRITPTGMTWGNMNGMQPRAVVLFEGKLRGDELSGQSRFGGIDFKQDDGSPPPPLYFSFKRVRT